MKISELPTPAYVVDQKKIRENLEILRDVAERAGCRILLAQKAFSMYALYPLIGEYLAGTAASGLYEARLGAEEMGGETHVFSAAYKEEELDELLSFGDHIIFNSLAQLVRFAPRIDGRASIGLRVNPEHSTQEQAIYDPCQEGSRLGVTASLLAPLFCGQEISAELAEAYEKIEGLHFHTLCEQDADALEETFLVVEESFAPLLQKVKWINFGGGHHITRADYDRDRLIRLVRRVREQYGLEVYLEPGEAIALDAGYLVAEVLDIVENGGIRTLILDASASCHMPDVLEMPYRPPLFYPPCAACLAEGEGGEDHALQDPGSLCLAGGITLNQAGKAEELPQTYRISSRSCLAGDIVGDYSFAREIHTGERLYFGDMAIYTMVKNNSFNGMPLPLIALMDEDGDCRVVRQFDYEDFKMRLS